MDTRTIEILERNVRQLSRQTEQDVERVEAKLRKFIQRPVV